MALKIGVIGTGRIGRIHARHLRDLPGVSLAALTDIDSDSARSLASDLGGAVVRESAQQVLGDPEIDAVAICSSTDTHAPLIMEAAEAGKHIFCEKPIDHDLGAIDRALAAVEKAGVKLQIGFNRRFDPSFAKVQAQVAAGEVGELHLVRITSRDPSPPPLSYVRVSGGLFFDMTIHDFDMARFLVGCEPTRVFATGGVRVDPAIGEAGDIDTAVVVLDFEDDTIVTIDNSRKAVYGYDQRIEVFGSGGVAWAENNTPHRTGLGNASGMHTPKPLDFFTERYGESYRQEMREFVTSIQKDTAVPVTGRDGRVPVVMGMAAARSLAERRPVALSEFSE